MFWFDRADERVVFGDIRRAEYALPDKSSAGGSRHLIIDPDQQLDFRALPFSSETFHLVVFDPPHLIQNGKSGWLAKKYGKLGEDWRSDISAGFAECFRVLRPHGTLVFKWNEHEVKVSELLKLTPEKPLFGNRCGKTAKSHWIVFTKTDDGALGRQDEVVPQPRDEPISCSPKGEAVPVISEEMVEAGAQAIVDERWAGSQPGFNRKPPGWKVEHMALARACLTAALSLPRPASDKGEEADLVDDYTVVDDRIHPSKDAALDAAILDTRPSTVVSREEVAAAAWTLVCSSEPEFFGDIHGYWAQAKAARDAANSSDAAAGLIARCYAFADALLSRGEG